MPIGQHQMVQWMLADMATAIEGARLLIWQAASLKDAGRPFSTKSAMAKLFAADMAMKVTTDAVQIHGGYGFIREYEVDRFFRDAKITQIYEGTSQIQKLVIARAVLGGKVTVAESSVLADLNFASVIIISPALRGCFGPCRHPAPSTLHFPLAQAIVVALFRQGILSTPRMRNSVRHFDSSQRRGRGVGRPGIAAASGKPCWH